MRTLIVSADRSTDRGHPSNIGDALLTDALAGSIRARGHQVTVAEFGSPRLVGQEPRVYLRGIGALLRQIRSSQAVVLGGGTLLQDHGHHPLKGLPRLMFVVSVLGWITGRPVTYFSVGCDPVSRWPARLLLRMALFRRTVWVRDAASVLRCRELGARDVRMAADVSLLLRPAFAEQSARPWVSTCDEGAPFVLVALAAADASGLTSDMVTQLKSVFARVVFVQMYQGDDTGDGSLLVHDVREGVDQVTEQLSWEQAASIFGGAAVVIASRMHALYLGMMLGKPLVAIGSLPKIGSFAAEFGIRRFEKLDEAVAARGWQMADGNAVDNACRRVELAMDDLFGTVVDERDCEQESEKHDRVG